MDPPADGGALPPGICCWPPPTASLAPPPPQQADVSLLKTDSFASTDTAVVAAAPTTTNPDDDTTTATTPLALRRRFFAPNATLSHSDAPLTLSRGTGCRLYCANTGRAYLDAQNNVAHLGHGHAGLAAAVGAQLLTLNTNSRYVSEDLGPYCRELVETLPLEMRRGDEQDQQPLVYLTNSGSEANDLALRVARAHHAHRFGASGGGDQPAPRPAFHVAVLGGAYHGHLDSVVRLSPYKFWSAPPPSSASSSSSSSSASAAAARTKPPFVHVIPLPDEYRGGQATRFCDGAAAARAVCQAARRSGGRVGLVLVEAVPSCAGQCLLPPGLLAALFSTFRQEEPNVLCCVDEVQTGFGRVGAPYFWAFEPQLLPKQVADAAASSSPSSSFTATTTTNNNNCLPDLLTFGKPAGNGFPLAGLIATHRAARAFSEHSGELYFNTYGGSNASVAAGRAVLRAVREERLAERASATGGVLGQVLRRLADAHRQHVMDVRGVGLFWGVEIGRVGGGGADDEDAAPTIPAPVKASWLARRMRDFAGVLVSVDGVYGNVLKIKPPMVFGAQEARELAAALDAAFSALSGNGALAAEEAAALERREREAFASIVAPVREVYERNARELGLLL